MDGICNPIENVLEYENNLLNVLSVPTNYTCFSLGVV